MSSDTIEITLVFRDQVALSRQNISIYQVTDGNFIIRQGFSAKSGFCSVMLNDLAVTCQIFKSTFNQPDATYNVVVDNDFVMSKSLNQPLNGVAKGNWVYYGGMRLTNSNILGLLNIRSLISNIVFISPNDRKVYR